MAGNTSKYVRFYRFVNEDEHQMVGLNDIIFGKGLELEERVANGESRYDKVGTATTAREYWCQFNNSIGSIKGIKFGIVKVGNNEIAKTDGTLDQLTASGSNKGLMNSTHMVLFDDDIIGVVLHGSSPRVGTFLRYMDVKFNDYFSSENIITKQIVDKESMERLFQRDRTLEGFRARISPKEFLTLFPDQQTEIYKDNFEKEVIVELRVKLRSKPKDLSLAQRFVGGVYEMISDEINLDNAEVDLTNSAFRNELLQNAVYKFTFNSEDVTSNDINNNDVLWYNGICDVFDKNKDAIVNGFCIGDDNTQEPDESQANV